MLDVDNAADYLLTHALIEPDAVIDATLTIRSAARRNCNLRVERSDGTGYFIRQPVLTPEGEFTTVEREARFYAYCERTPDVAPLTRYLPRMVCRDGPARLHVVELLPASRSLGVYHGSHPARQFPIEASRCLGEALGTLHRTFRRPGLADTGELAWLSAPVPWPLQLHRPAPEILAHLSPAGLYLIEILQREPGLAARIDQAEHAWLPDTVIHGDIKSDNILVCQPEGRPAAVELRLIDWELVQVGDAAWDLGSALHDYLVFWTAAMPMDSAPTIDQMLKAARYPLAILRQVWVPKERRHLIAGFYLAVGDADDVPEPVPESGPRPPLVRFYWHLTAEAALEFVSAATRLLNTEGVPFRLKLPNDREAYTRADAGVLYVRRAVATAILPLIETLSERLRGSLRPSVPLFTWPLAEGVALAEDPGQRPSFGEHRCGLVAQALWRSFGEGDARPEARAHTLAQVFREQGLDPERPCLGPYSTLDLERFRPFSRTGAPAGRATAGSSRQASSPAPSNGLLEAATQIGADLCRAAIWDRSGRYCNWMARSTAELGPEGALIPTTEATGYSLYDGSAGIALFLARLFGLTGLAEARTTALGAIARSLRQLERAPAPTELAMSVFVGTLGVAYAGRQIAALIGDASLAERSESLLESICLRVRDSDPLDVLEGKAGAIPVLLEWSAHTGRSELRGVAETLGDQIIQRARQTGSVWTWSRDGPGAAAATQDLPLTGLSHGASGIAWSLLELHAATSRREYLEAATGAFAYEDSLFEQQLGNWPDLRDRTGQQPTPTPLRYVRGWCHGAPGIALARLQAATLDPAGCLVHLAMARAAVATTIDAIETAQGDPTTDASLCHGVAGWIEVVATAAALLGEPAYRERAERAAQALLQSKPASGHWPSGVASRGPNPSLMLGQAGIGYLCLRLHDVSAAPSVLLPGASRRELAARPNAAG